MADQLSKITAEQCDNPPASYEDLSVLFLNCTLSRSPIMSHTEGLMTIGKNIFEANGVSAEMLRPVDYDIAAGLGMNMADTPEWESDD